MINIRSRDEIELIRESGQLVAGALDLAARLVGPGIETVALDKEIEDYIIGNGATPEFKGFHGYPAAICASVNEEVVHGIPGSRALRNGDIVGIDVGVRKNGYVADGARTFAVGGITEAHAIAQMAATHHLPFAPHDCTGPVIYTAATHMSVHEPNGSIQESVRAFYNGGWYTEVATSLPIMENGYVRPPEGPGLGTELLPDIRQRSDAVTKRIIATDI